MKSTIALAALFISACGLAWAAASSGVLIKDTTPRRASLAAQIEEARAASGPLSPPRAS